MVVVQLLPQAQNNKHTLQPPTALLGQSSSCLALCCAVGSAEEFSVNNNHAKFSAGVNFVLQDELLNVIYWWRQVSGVLLGILIGLARVTGVYGMAM